MIFTLSLTAFQLIVKQLECRKRVLVQVSAYLQIANGIIQPLQLGFVG